MSFKIIGHRGMGPTSLYNNIPQEQAPENTLRAFQQALDMGADGLEFDVALSKDQQIVVIHDDELNKNVSGANRGETNLGYVSDFTVAELKGFNVGHDEKIPTLRETLDLIIENNTTYKDKTGNDLIINIELKGEDVVDETYAIMMEYVDSGKLPKEAFLFNTFKWDRLKKMREKDADVRLVPNIKTINLFSLSDVQMPGFCVDGQCSYEESKLQELQKLHDEIDCFAFDCVVYDLREPLLKLCEVNKIGMYASTSNDRAVTTDLPIVFGLLHQYSKVLPATMFKADHAGRALTYKNILENGQDATRMVAAHYLSNSPVADTLPQAPKPAK